MPAFFKRDDSTFYSFYYTLVLNIFIIIVSSYNNTENSTSIIHKTFIIDATINELNNLVLILRYEEQSKITKRCFLKDYICFCYLF